MDHNVKLQHITNYFTSKDNIYPWVILNLGHQINKIKHYFFVLFGNYQMDIYYDACMNHTPSHNHINWQFFFCYNNNNNDFFCANILEDQAQWRDKTKGLSKLIIVKQCVSRQWMDEEARRLRRIGSIKEIGI